MQLTLFIFGFLLFWGLVLVHEWGHYIVAKRNSVKVEEFALGFPPRIISRKLKSGLIVSLNWLPLGGFVKLKGEHDSDTHSGSFGAASLGAKSRIMLAGVGMNLLVGLILLTILALVGMPKLIDKDLTGQDQFTVASDTKTEHIVFAGDIIAGSPAAKIGLTSRDTILTVSSGNDKRQITDRDSLHKATSDFASKNVDITFKHQGQTLTKSVHLLSQAEVAASQNTNQPKGYLGISPADLQIRRSTWSAPLTALGFTKQLTILTFRGLGHALGGLGSAVAGWASGNHQARENGQKNASSQVGGPVAVFSLLWNYGALGINFVLLIIAVISLTLAIMNALPIPALDGGRLFMILVSRGIFRRPLNKLIEERVAMAGFMLVMGLIVLITVVDVRRFF